jgi:thiol-disulfide isomerase/thioredoxin
MRVLLRLIPVLGLFAACAPPATPADPPPPVEGAMVRVSPAAFGEPFPSYIYNDLNAASGSGGRVNLATFLGKKPVVFVYWIPGRQRSEQMLLEIQRIAGEAGEGKLAAFGVVRARAGLTVPDMVERIQALKVTLPVLNDEEFRLGQQLSVRTVPSVAIVDAAGKLRLASAGSLKQELEYKLDVEGAVTRVAATGTIGTYGLLPRYEPVNEMIGKRSPEFEAPSIDGGGVQRWSSLLDAQRVNVMVFWSVDCPHCKKSLPVLNDWVREHPGEVNVVSLANVTDDTQKLKTRDYVKLNQFVFPTIEDRGMRIGELYQVSSTPTILIIRPDGVIDSVLLGEASDYGKAFLAKKKELLGS